MSRGAGQGGPGWRDGADPAPEGPDAAAGGDAAASGDGGGDVGDEGGGEGGEGLTPRQQGAISALLVSPTVARAAEQCGVPERTLRRWLGEPLFRRAYREARRRAFEHAVSLAQQYAPAAITTLARIMTDPGAKHAARVTAASSLLRFGRESVELDELVERVEALEGAAGGGEGGGP